MKLRPWPWVTFDVRELHHQLQFTMQAEIPGRRYVAAQFAMSLQEMYYCRVTTAGQYALHHKFRAAYRAMAQGAGEDPNEALRRYMELPARIVE